MGYFHLIFLLHVRFLPAHLSFFSIFHSIILLKWVAIWSNVMNRPLGWPLEQKASLLFQLQRIFKDFLAALNYNKPCFSVAQTVQSQGHGFNFKGKQELIKCTFYGSIVMIQPTRSHEKIQLFFKVVISCEFIRSNLYGNIQVTTFNYA